MAGIAEEKATTMNESMALSTDCSKIRLKTKKNKGCRARAVSTSERTWPH
ncbi:MAG TPA: hypothetical protein PLM29_06250 [Deltaproteobacteria bacterium]|nr:hypothetical protein [Deltaproteobacteria bacterium]